MEKEILKQSTGAVAKAARLFVDNSTRCGVVIASSLQAKGYIVDFVKPKRDASVLVLGGGHTGNVERLLNGARSKSILRKKPLHNPVYLYPKKGRW